MYSFFCFSDPSKEDELWPIPDIEIFFVDEENSENFTLEDGTPLKPGWYWWKRRPGEIEETEATGPYNKPEHAYVGMRSFFSKED